MASIQLKKLHRKKHNYTAYKKHTTITQLTHSSYQINCMISGRT